MCPGHVGSKPNEEVWTNSSQRKRNVPAPVTSWVSAASGAQVMPPSVDFLTTASTISGAKKKFGSATSTPKGLYQANMVGKVPRLPKPLTCETTGVPEPSTSVI